MLTKRRFRRLSLLPILLGVAATVACSGLNEDLDDLDFDGESDAGPQQPGEFAVKTVDVTVVGATSAIFAAEIVDLGTDGATDHGFCWSTQTAPTAENGECMSLGATSDMGSFSQAAEDLQPGVSYFVRAFVEATDSRTYGDELSFNTEAPAPTGLVVTEEAESDGVHLQWDDMPGAQNYLVYRDDEQIQAVEEATFYDENVAVGELPPVQGLRAASERIPDHAKIMWDAVDEEDIEVRSYDYAVSAVYADSESELSDRVEATPAPPDLEYAVHINGGETVVHTEDTIYRDDDAPKLKLNVNNLFAGDGEDPNVVRLEFSLEAESMPESSDYRVQVVRSGDEAGPKSDEVSARRGNPDNVVLRVERAEEQEENFESIGDIYAEFGDDFDEAGPHYFSYSDNELPPGSSSLFYRIHIQQTGIAEVFSDVTDWHNNE